MATRRDERRTKAALADRPVQGLLTDTQKARRRAGADELVISIAFPKASDQRLGILGKEAPVATRGDQRRPQLSSRDGA